MFGRYDFVVAGSGAGGACVSGRLAAAGARVLVLEKGGFARPQADAMEAFVRYYASAGFSSAFGNALMLLPTGVTVGGTTTINSGTCLRPTEALVRGWESVCPGFEGGRFMGYLDEAWKAVRVRRAPEATLSRSSRLFLDGLSKLGVPGGERLHRCEDGCSGSGRCCFVCPTGKKMTAFRAFLEPLPEGRRPRISPRTELLRVRSRGKGGVDVEVRTAGGSRETIECGTLILAGGALRSPYYVRAGSLGPGAGSAGDGLSVHPAAKVFGRFEAPVRGWEGVPQGAGVADPEDDGIRYEGVYTPPEIAAITMPLEGVRLRWWMDNYHHVATFGFMIRDEARGRIRYPLGPWQPLVRYDMTPRDVSRMDRGLRFTAGALLAAGAERTLVPLNRPGNEPDSPEAVRGLAPAVPGELQVMAFHPLGTCAMGRVVDEDLRACPGVYVCDGSVVPESLGVNPQITIYAFALRLADHLLGRKEGKR